MLCMFKEYCTCASNSISSIALFTGTSEATNNVSTEGIITTVVKVQCTFIDTYEVHNYDDQFYVHVHVSSG